MSQQESGLLNANTTDSAEVSQVRVWDPLVRVFHWGLALAFAVAYVTEDDLLQLHVWAGYIVGALVAFRIIWGVIGTKHARFWDFLFGPATTLGYLKDLGRFKAKRYIGHSPAGAAMTFALLISIAATVWSGLEVYAVEENAGPLASTTTVQMAGREAPRARLIFVSDDEGEDGGKDDFWEEIHEVLANLTLALVFLHIAGVLFASFVHKENLARAMITGRKRRE